MLQGRLLRRYSELIDRLERIFRRFAEGSGAQLALGFRELAEMAFFMADGFLLHQLLDNSVGDDLYGRMLTTFFTGSLAETGKDSG